MCSASIYNSIYLILIVAKYFGIADELSLVFKIKS